MFFSAIVACVFIRLAQAFFVIHCGTVRSGRIDPIVSPSKVSGHAHTIGGASNIDINSTYESLQQSECSSCNVDADKSAYWTPTLYYQRKDGSIVEVPQPELIIYYFGRGKNTTIEPFPPGFKMLAGRMTARSYDTVTKIPNSDRLLADALEFQCINGGPGGSDLFTRGLTTTNCPGGLRAELHFQSCWDGREYQDDNSHVAYMSDIAGGVCPPTHPRHFVHLFYEMLFSVNAIDQSDGGRFVFSQGDPTGYGFHGDFFNGWDSTVLANAVANGTQSCAWDLNSAPGYKSDIKDCPYFTDYIDSTIDWNCPEYPPVFNEPIHGEIGRTLPGCNAITNGPVREGNSCPAGGNNPTPTHNDLPAQTAIVRAKPTPGQTYGSTTYTYSGCYSDNVAGRKTIDVAAYYQDDMSVGKCLGLCSSFALPYKYAGLAGGHGNQCFCGNTLNTAPADANYPCTAHCDGAANETCGGTNLMSLYNNTKVSANQTFVPGAGPTGTDAGIYRGCASEVPGGQRALTGPSYVDVDNMTLESCGTFCSKKGYALAGTEYMQECYCGNSLLNGGELLAKNSTCNMLCKGNNGETCGGSWRLSVFAQPPGSAV